jgi:hypothetical protein
MQLNLMRGSVFIKSATTTLMVSNIAANFLMTSSLQMLWGMINTMQLMVILTLFNVPHPDSVIQMTKLITQVTRFNLIPTDLILGQVLTFDPTRRPISPHFERIDIF